MPAKNVVAFFLASAPTADDIARLAEVQGSVRAFRLDQMVEHPAPIEHMVLEATGDAADGATCDSYEWAPPYPIELMSWQATCLTAAGATGTVTLSKKPSGGSYAAVSTAAVDIKTTLKVYQNGTIVDTAGADMVAVGDTLKFIFSSGAGGALAGGRAILYYRRQRASTS